ncbi:MAG: methylisocitrate lyase [Proteobacteria bacterium]|nr:methylisocitrate lyase [Pseudomonadota bacterium]
MANADQSERPSIWFAGAADGPPAGRRLADLLARPGILGVPGAHDGLSGLLARKAGFECLYISGAALTAGMGLPDLGVMTMEELCTATRTVARATGLPLIVDGDTGYGEALNVMRLVRELEDAGAAAVQIEDQLLPKKCGHLNDKQLATAEDAARKIAAAVSARRHLLVVARTDAAAESLDEAIRRANLYVAAGADIVFPDALISDEDFQRFTAAVKAPVLANMTEFGRTPQRTAAQLAALGCKIVIWPASSLRVAARAVADLYAELAEKGGAQGMLARMQTRAELYETIRYHEFEALDDTIAQSVVPESPD